MILYYSYISKLIKIALYKNKAYNIYDKISFFINLNINI